MHCSFYRIFKFYFITFFLLVVYCGAPVLRMRGALANDTIWYDMIGLIIDYAGTPNVTCTFALFRKRAKT